MELKIDRLGINGEGVAIIDSGERENKVCFIDGALPNEIVDATLTQEKTNYCFAELDNIKVPSIDRVKPKCPYFGVCGGCDIQHMNDNLQAKLKKNTIVDTLRKLGGIENVAVDDVVRVNSYEYRNKMVFPYIQAYTGESVLGMFAKNSHDIIDIDGCMLANAKLNNFLKYSKEYLKKSKWKGYNFASHSGDIKYLVARNNASDILVTIVATHMLDGLEDYYKYLSRYYIHVGLSIVISDKKSKDIMSGNYQHLYGDEYLYLEEDGLRYKVDNRGFLQVNTDVKKYLYDYVLSNIESGSNVIDAYSGAGLMSGIIAKKCKTVYSIEINKSASHSAKELANNNQLNNMKCICGNVDDYLKKCIIDANDCIVVLDPARAGCNEKTLEVLNEFGGNTADYSPKAQLCRVSKIIYISCNIVTLSRDLKVLSECYKIKSVLPIDMFPQTSHCEVVVILENKSKI